MFLRCMGLRYKKRTLWYAHRATQSYHEKLKQDSNKAYSTSQQNQNDIFSKGYKLETERKIPLLVNMTSPKTSNFVTARKFSSVVKT